MAQKRVVVLTGASSGIGKACAERFVQDGCTVYDFSRHNGCTEGVIHRFCDVTDEQTVRDAVAQVVRECGRIDVLVCCAGMGISGAAEFTPQTDVRRQFDVNFFGTDNTVRAVLPVLRKAGGGHILCVGSVAGVYPIPFQAYYSATKAAVQAYAAALANEVRAFGISVSVVMPGDIRTGFTSARQKIQTGDDVYEGRISRSVAVMEQDERKGMDPREVARTVFRVASRPKAGPRYTVGLFYQMLVFLQRILPAAAVNFIIGKMYVKEKTQKEKTE